MLKRKKFSPVERAFIALRADDCCEYCQITSYLSGVNSERPPVCLFREWNAIRLMLFEHER